MTFSLYSLPIEVVTSPRSIPTPEPRPSEVDVIVPVKDDPLGLKTTLGSLTALNPAPNSIHIVDDGSTPPLDIAGLTQNDTSSVQIHTHVLATNRGAAAARNVGVASSASPWIYFTDCSCRHPTRLLETLCRSWGEDSSPPVAICGPVEATNEGRISTFMTCQRNLFPPMENGTVQALVTANAMVSRQVGDRVRWFDESFPGAGGEDIDLGLRIRRFGPIAWNAEATVTHQFVESLESFDDRFKRYGRGLYLLERKWKADLEPYRFSAISPELQDLADRQFAVMLKGYCEARHEDSGRTKPVDAQEAPGR